MPLRVVRPDAPAELEALLARALAKTPAERPTMAELASLLPGLLATPGSSRQLAAAAEVALVETLDLPTRPGDL
jgi:hypothetical protein